MRWKWIPVIVPMLLIGLMSAIAAAQEGDVAALAFEARERTSMPLYNDQDLLFLRHMSIHHQQAVVMSSMVPARTDRDEFIRFARYVKRAQAAEIEVMESMLDIGADRGLELPDHGPHGDPPMDGMLSTAEMDALAAASGAEFERSWLEGMIFHHEGGLAMAREQQRQQLENGRRPYVIDVLVEDILVEQRAEITKMRAWLSEWGLASIPDTNDPDAAVTSPTTVRATVPLDSTTFVGMAIDARGRA